jgi:ADP-heptose:LPS heptosyltransferase
LPPPRHIAAIRLSSLGDVAMCVPVVRRLLGQHPDLRLTFVSDRAFAPLFDGIERLNFHPADPKGAHRGLRGLLDLYRGIVAADAPDAVADLHAVLRTRILRIFFLASRTPYASIDKGRAEKRALTRREGKLLRPLPATFERYAAVFAALSRSVDLSRPSAAARRPPAGPFRVGVAPFARHAEKAWPPERMHAVVQALAARGDVEVSLFGGGRTEAALLAQWVDTSGHVRNCAAGMDLADQLGVMSGLDLMVSMDSANMHLASLFDVPVVSVWGGTHPHAGFLGWGQTTADAVQLDMDCRPCSVFGNRPCWKGTRECLSGIPPERVLERISQKLETLGTRG